MRGVIEEQTPPHATRKMFVLLVLNLLLCKAIGAPNEYFNGGILVKEVFFGETVLLQCKSNGEDYNFDYWLFDNGKAVIGPSNNYDRLKYKYEILSGNLTIRVGGRRVFCACLALKELE